jgi:hypothetical protein
MVFHEPSSEDGNLLVNEEDVDIFFVAKPGVICSVISNVNFFTSETFKGDTPCMEREY